MITRESEFLESALRDLRTLEQDAAAHYHGILAQLLSAARRETEMLIREEQQAQRWPDSTPQVYARVR